MRDAGRWRGTFVRQGTASYHVALPTRLVARIVEAADEPFAELPVVFRTQDGLGHFVEVVLLRCSLIRAIDRWVPDEDDRPSIESAVLGAMLDDPTLFGEEDDLLSPAESPVDAAEPAEAGSEGARSRRGRERG